MAEPLVGLIMGSDSDWGTMQKCVAELKAFGIPFEAHVMSAHRTPERAATYASEAEARGLKVLICAAGMAAHLAGVIAGNTTLPVLGVLAAQILALSDPALREKLHARKAEMAQKVAMADAKLQESL